jgi:hypothetical protein
VACLELILVGLAVAEGWFLPTGLARVLLLSLLLLPLPMLTLGAIELVLVYLAVAEGWFLSTWVASVLLLSLLLLPSPMLTLGAMELMLVDLAVAEGWFLLTAEGWCLSTSLANLAVAEGWFLPTGMESVLLLSLLLLPLLMLTLGAMELMLVDLAVAEGWFLPTGGGECGLRQWMLGMPKLASNLKESGMLGVFFGGRMPLAPNPSCQLLVFAASRHFFIKVRKPAFLSAGFLSLVMWLVTLAQLS